MLMVLFQSFLYTRRNIISSNQSLRIEQTDQKQSNIHLFSKDDGNLFVCKRSAFCNKIF